MIKRIVCTLLAAVMVCIAGCATLGNIGKEIPKLTIPSENYRKEIVPLIDVLKLVYAEKISEERKKFFKAFLDDLDRQSLTQPEVNVLPAIVAVAVPVVLEKTSKKVQLTFEQNVAALAGLALLESKFGEDPVAKQILPAIEEVLKNNVSIQQGKK